MGFTHEQSGYKTAAQRLKLELVIIIVIAVNA